MDDKQFLQAALTKAKESVALGGFPAGAVVVRDGRIVGEGISVGNKMHDPTSHGEMAAIRTACKNLKTSDLSESTLYASMQPCLMCLGAAMWSAIPRIVFACPQSKVSTEYYGGHYKPAVINAELIRPIELAHFAQLEADSLAIVRQWEELLSSSQ